MRRQGGGGGGGDCGVEEGGVGRGAISSNGAGRCGDHRQELRDLQDREQRPAENGEAHGDGQRGVKPRPLTSVAKKEGKMSTDALGAGTGVDVVVATEVGARVEAETKRPAAAATTEATDFKVNEVEEKKEEKKARKEKRQKKTEDGLPSQPERKEQNPTISLWKTASREAVATPSKSSTAGGSGGGGGGGDRDCAGGSEQGVTGSVNVDDKDGEGGKIEATSSSGKTTESGDAVVSPLRTPTTPRDPAAPSALDKVLEQLGLLPQSRLTGEAAAAAELEGKYRAVALAARADAQTLPLRLERQARLREQAERNVAAEADELARALHRLNYLCKEAESVELLGAARDQIHFVLRAAKCVAATAETMGALRLEARMSGWMEASLRYNDQLKLQLETARSEQEEMKRVLSESGASIDSNSPQTAAVRRSLLSAKMGSQRRASIAAPPRPAATSTSTNKDQGRLSLAFVPGSPAASPPILRLGTGRRPLSSASSDTTVGGTGIESSTPSPSIVPDDFTPRMDEVVSAPMEDDAVDSGGIDEPQPRNSLPKLSVAGLVDPEAEVLSVPHLHRRESSVVAAVASVAPPCITTVHSTRSLYQSTAISDLLEYVWPPDFFACVQHARWLLVRLLVLAAIWCLIQAFMSPADACEQYTSDLSIFDGQIIQYVARPD